MARPAFTSVAAIAGVVAASSCCLPVLPFVAAAGLAGGSAFLWMARPYLLAGSILLVALGFWQAARSRKCGRRPSAFTSALLWLSAAVVALSFVLPQAAGAVVSLTGGNRAPAGQPALSDLTTHTAADLRTAFNAAKDDARLLLFLSPT
ncbi:MAG TPA: hypothetical protein VGS58_05240 [Candidatus Sulfopaludibacter sp.]|nr:hypothetical protein [Candidatus Sulfopaludibacter sp.]